MQSTGAAAAGEAEVSFERLEYGKLCTSHDGPIEPGVESYPLATSPGFSSLVEPHCRPWLLGIGADLVAVPGVRHGTVLRCVRLQGRPVPVFCRLRQRPEGGEGAEGRRFWQGRYVYAGTMDPLTGFNALEKRPLRGITIPEARSKDWAPIRVPRSLRPAVDPVLGGFLQEALEYVLSGIAVGVSRAPDEETFFRWAAVLWHLLPPPLRPVFSAGWAVTAEVAQSLSFSWSPQVAPTLAVIDVDRGRWTPPERLEVLSPAGESRPRLFTEQSLVPGRAFLLSAFPPDGRVGLSEAVPRPDHLQGFDFGIRGADSEPDWIVDTRSGWAWDRFRRPGLRSLDHARLQRVEHWLAGVRAGDPGGLCLSTGDYFFQDSRKRLLELGLGALATPALWPRADEIVWRSLIEDSGSHALLDEIPLPEKESSRVRLFQVLARGELPQLLAALDKAQELGGAANLPPVVRDRLEDLLRRSLEEPGLLDSHRALLAVGKLAEAYRSWAEASAGRLAVMLFTAHEPVTPEVFSRLRKLADDPVIDSMRRLQKGEPPTHQDLRALSSLSPTLAEKLAERLYGLWKLRDLETRRRREALCPWLQAVKPLRTEDPLVAFLAPSAETTRLQREERAALAEEIRCDHVPPSLQPRVAALVLWDWEHYDEFHRTKGLGNSGWGAVFKHWPPAVVRALADAVPGTSWHAVDPAILAVLGQLSLRSSFLDRQIEVLLQRRKDYKLFAEVAEVLWNLCMRAIPGPGEIRIADICRGLAEGELPDGLPTPPGDPKLAAAAHLARPHLTSLPPGLWERAGQGWQIRFLLEAAPHADLQPTTEQLVALLPFRSWLKKHLDDHPHRGELFDIASRPFHKAIYDEKLWRPEYSASPLWAAFRGVPLGLQGDLRQALKVYSAGEAQPAERFVKNALKYFEDLDFAYLNQTDQQMVLERLAKAVIAPLMREGGLKESDAARLITAGNWKQSSDDVQVHEDAFNALAVGEKGVLIIAVWFMPLLERIWKRECQDEMVKAIRHVAREVWRQ